MNWKVLSISAAASAALTGTALADDPAGAPASPDPAQMTPAPPGGTGAWTMEIISRPLTVKAGMIGVQGDFAIARASITIAGMTSSATSEALLVGGRYGVSDTLEIGASYGVTLNEFEAKGPLTVSGLFNVKDDAQLKLAPGAALTYDLNSEVATLRAGLAAQYNITPRLAVFAPPTHLRITLASPDVAGVSAPKPVDLSLPVGLGLQASPNIFGFLQTTIATIDISDSATSVIFSDFTPLTVGAFYSPSNAMDLGAQIQFLDLANAGDFFVILLTARLFVM